MKNHFKHQFGYINIDDEYLYFTKSGNWVEAKKLDGIIPKRVSKMWLFMCSVSLISLFILFRVFDSFELDLLEEVSLNIIGIVGLNLCVIAFEYYAPKPYRISLENILHVSSAKNYEPFLQRYEIEIQISSVAGNNYIQRVLMHKFEFWELRDRLAVVINSEGAD